MKILNTVLAIASFPFLVSGTAWSVEQMSDCKEVDGKSTCQSIAGDPVPMKKDYWSPENSTGAIAFTVDGKIRSFVFISVDGKRMVLSYDAVSRNERAHQLLMALMELGHLDNVSYDSGCTNVEDEKKLEKLANPSKFEGDHQEAPR